MWNRIHIDETFLNNAPIDIDFFKNTKEKNVTTQMPKSIVSIFGRNGSGKTTIAKEIQMLSTDSINFENDDIPMKKAILQQISPTGDLVNQTGDPVEHSIFVYDQQFIDRHVRLAEGDRLEAVVRLSDQPKLHDKLEGVQEQLRVSTSQLEQQNKVVRELEQGEAPASPLKAKEKLRNDLKRGKWLANLMELSHGNRINITDARLIEIEDSLQSLEPRADRSVVDQNKSDLEYVQQKLDRVLGGVREAQNGEPIPAYSVIENPRAESRLREAIERTLPNPVDDDYHQRIVDTVSEAGVSIKDRLRMFSDDNLHYCPTCLRDINSDEKEKIVVTTQEVLKKLQSENLAEDLSTARPNKLTAIPLSSEYVKLCPTIVEKVNIQISVFNDAVDKIDQVIKSKIENPYQRLKFPPISLDSLYDEVIAAQRELASKIRIYNSRFVGVDKSIQTAKKLNNQIAAIELSTDFKEWHQAELNLTRQQSSLQVLDKKTEDLQQQIVDVQTELKSLVIALDDINRMLAYVFFDGNRLKLEQANDSYRVLSRNKPIPLEHLSTGEQNAISLAYFFSSINAGTDASKIYTGSNFVVLDDPISSFDHETKVGMLSLISEKSKEILFGNSTSRILFLTHDFEIFNHLNKVAEDTEKLRKKLVDNPNQQVQFGYQSVPTDKVSLNSYFLKYPGGLIPAGKKRNDYANELNSMYEFATTATGKDEDTAIGNRMRRVVEAFASFCYANGPTDIFKDPDVLTLLTDPKLIHFYSGFMSSIILNGASHTEAQVHSITDSSWGEFFDHDELLKTDRLILLFLLLVNPLHLKKMIKNFDESTVLKWQSLIPS